MKAIADAGRGIITYHPSQEGLGHGLAIKLRSYDLMDSGVDQRHVYRALGEPTEDPRDFLKAAWILRYFGYNRVRLITNNLKKASSLEDYGISVTERVPVIYQGPDRQIREYVRVRGLDDNQDISKENLERKP